MKYLITLILFIPIILFGQSTLETAQKKYKSGDYETAKKEYLNVIKSDSSSYGAYLGLANCNYKLKNYNEALINYTKAIELKKDNPDAYALRAETYYTLQEFDKAILDYTKMIDLNSKDIAFAYYMRGLCKSVLPQQDVDGACKDIRKAKKLGMDVSMPGLNKYCNSTDLE